MGINIKRNIQFSLKPRKYKGVTLTENLQIRMRVTFAGIRFDLFPGYVISENMWIPEAQRPKKGAVNGQGVDSSDITSALNKWESVMNDTFKQYEVEGVLPTKADLIKRFDKNLKDQDKKSKGINLKSRPVINRRDSKKKSSGTSFYAAFSSFIEKESVKNSWQYSTVQKFMTLRTHLMNFRESLTFEYFTDNGLTEFVGFLLEEEHLANRTINKQMANLRWFLRWAHNNGYHENNSFEHFKPRLTTTPRKVIFLSIPEIKKLLSYEVPATLSHLDRVRDVLIFCCFTGLRHSDVANLRRSDVKDGCIEITTLKTADSITIELNDVSKKILEKYEKIGFKDNAALPVISNQKTNDYLKELCKLAGIDEPVRVTTYQGPDRVDVVEPKYNLITTHTGRRSFICNALAQGIPVNVVMKWTGHSDYKAMKPYIDVADSIKATEMNKMNNLL